MNQKILIILFAIFSAYAIKAQAGNDSLTLFNQVASFKLTDVGQQKNTRIHSGDRPLSLFFFLSPECPLCRNYTKSVNELQQKFNQQLNIYGIAPGNTYSVKELQAFIRKYHLAINIWIDSRQQLTRYLKATVTPQVILLNDKGGLIYTGAIDDWVQGLGKNKPKATQHYLQDAIQQTLQQQEVTIKKTPVFGCKINDY